MVGCLKKHKTARVAEIFVLVLLLLIKTLAGSVTAEEVKEEPKQLYARSCVLMDGTTGRVLFEKNGYEQMPMASTTKIMTLIVALENSNPDDEVEVSAYAAGQPKVHLGMHAGQRFCLSDLYYSLMLESHNDSAVAIAEYVGSRKLALPAAGERTKEESEQAVLAFTDMMNEKARDIGCFDTCFLTPNGLDATATLKDGSQKMHSTTAANLASILAYCITTSVEKEEFLKITRTSSYAFTDISGQSSYSCQNHNAFLGMMDGALTGKTGFTNQAGYCYVGALHRDNKLFIVALLACGWPNNKGYKWSDTKKLMDYGLTNYENEQVFEKPKELPRVAVEQGRAGVGEQAYVKLEMEEEGLEILLRQGEQVQIDYQIPKAVKAPVKKGEMLGCIRYYIGETTLAVYPLYASETVDKKTYAWCVKKVIGCFLEKK